MSNFNKVMLMGNLTRDPERKVIPSTQTTVAEFGLAVNHRFKTQSGDQREEVVFVDCAAFGKTAETIANHCTKGRPLFIEGRLKFDTWEDRNGGGKRSKLSVVVDNFQFIGDRPQGDGEARPGRNLSAPASVKQEHRRRVEGEPVPAPRDGPFAEPAPDFRDADIPF